MIKHCTRYSLSKFGRNGVGGLRMANWAMTGRVGVLYLKGQF